VEPETLTVALAAATGMGCAVAGLLFLRYWKTTRDRLFAFFAASFGLMAANRLALIVAGDTQEATTFIYMVRLAAFLLIIVGVLEKNVKRSTGSS
jgi:Fe2+ transport system protein B